MNRRLLLLVPVALLFISVSYALSVPGESSLPPGLLNLGTTNNPLLFSALFGLLVFEIASVALGRTVMSNGAKAIGLTLGFITAVTLYYNQALLNFMFNFIVIAGAIGLLLVLIALPARNVGKFSRLIGLILVLVFFYLLLFKYPNVQTYLNNLLHFNVESSLPLVIVSAAVILIVILLVRLMSSHGSGLFRAIVSLFILILIATFFLPGFAVFFFDPLILIPTVLVILFLIIFALRRTRARTPEEITAKYQKELAKKRAKEQGKPGGISDKALAEAGDFFKYTDHKLSGYKGWETRQKNAKKGNETAIVLSDNQIRQSNNQNFQTSYEKTGDEELSKRELSGDNAARAELIKRAKNGDKKAYELMFNARNKGTGSKDIKALSGEQGGQLAIQNKKEDIERLAMLNAARTRWYTPLEFKMAGLSEKDMKRAGLGINPNRSSPVINQDSVNLLKTLKKKKLI
jgi:hypothetical protein